MGVIHTGVGQWQLSWTDELLFDTEAARARAAVLGPSSNLALRQLVAGDVSQLSEVACDTRVSDEELANLDVKVPLLQGSINDAKATLDGLGVKYNIVGEGPNIIAQSPLTGSSMSKDGTVWLFTEADYASSDDYLREVPDLVGLSATYANESIVYSELNYVARGASVTREDAVVNSQSIPPGSKVAKGTTIELEFIVNSNQD